MGDAACKLTERFHLMGMAKLFFRARALVHFGAKTSVCIGEFHGAFGDDPLLSLVHALQHGAGFDDIRNVGAGAEPALDLPFRIPHGDGAGEKPMIFPISAAKP
jgi:hypothetical protein